MTSNGGDPAVGRFGWKAQWGLLIDVVGQAMVDEMGFTNAHLHDGRADTVTEAIDAHQVQAIDARNAFFSLSSAEQNAILKFLRR